MTKMIWRDIRKVLPKGERSVLIFYPLEDHGHIVEVSNPAYVRKYAILAGYTHWAPIPYPLPRRKT